MNECTVTRVCDESHESVCWCWCSRSTRRSDDDVGNATPCVCWLRISIHVYARASGPPVAANGVIRFCVVEFLERTSRRFRAIKPRNKWRARLHSFTSNSKRRHSTSFNCCDHPHGVDIRTASANRTMESLTLIKYPAGSGEVFVTRVPNNM